MTVAQLIDILKKLPQDLAIYTEGECDGSASLDSIGGAFASFDKEQPVVIIVQGE